MNELFAYVIFPLFAFLLAVGAIIGTVLVTAAAVRWRAHAFPVLMYMLTIASILSIVLTFRHLAISEQGLVELGDRDVSSGIVSKLLLMAVVGTATALCLAWLFDMNKRLRASPRFVGRGLRAPTDIIIAFMVFYIAFSILPIPLGMHYYFHISLVYPFFVYLALFFYMQLSDQDPALVLKHCLALLVFSSIVYGAAAPHAAFQPGYVGLIPGFSLRLWGVTAHANSLGAVACAYFLMELSVPSKRRWVMLLALGAAFAVLVLTQSKTSLLTAMFGGAIVVGSRIWRNLSRSGQRINRSTSMFVAVLIGFSCILVAVIGAYAMFADSHLIRSIEQHLDARAVNDLSSGTGRLWIWQAAIHGGMENPLFGQGASFWNLENRLRLGLSGAVTAHNLYLQVFSRSGFVGLAGLLLFLGLLTRYAIRGAKCTDGASIAVLLVLLVRSMSEVPIAPNSVLGAEFFATMAYIYYIIDRGARATQLSGTPDVIPALQPRPHTGPQLASRWN